MLIVFYDTKGFVHHEYGSPGKTIKAKLDKSVLMSGLRPTRDHEFVEALPLQCVGAHQVRRGSLLARRVGALKLGRNRGTVRTCHRQTSFCFLVQKEDEKCAFRHNRHQ